MAIDKVIIRQNTSLIQDEVLAHRLGMIPIKADPRAFEMRAPVDDFVGNRSTGASNRVAAFPTDKLRVSDVGEDKPTNTLVFKLAVRCEKATNAMRDATTPEQRFENANGAQHVLISLENY